MSVEAAIQDRLVSQVGAVSGRVRQLRLRQHDTLPAIRVQLIDQPKAAHLRGYTNLMRSRVQVDVYSTSYAQATTIADAVDEALGPEPWSTGGSPETQIVFVRRDDRRPIDEPDELNQVRLMNDYIVFHK